MTKKIGRPIARSSRIAVIFILGIVGALRAQDLPIQHEVSVLNVEIPVRVFKGETFIDSLTLKDFQVFDNGVPQSVEAVYLIKKAGIQREEGAKGGRPQTARQFVLFFEMSEYLPEIDPALDRFLDEVFLPGDRLIVVTPIKTYNLREGAFTRLPKDRIKDQIRARLRSDILIGNAEYYGVIRDLQADISSDKSLQEKLEAYSVSLSRLESMRKVDEKGLLRFADFLKGLAGQKYVYFFYQRECVPQYDWKDLMQLMTTYHDDMAATFNLMENFQLFVRESGFDVGSVKRAFADSSVTIHFLFVAKTPEVDPTMAATGPGGLKMVEQSDDIFSAFHEIAAATGGITESSANAALAFKKAADASENYYLIYYKPNGYKADGSFHDLKVVVSNPSFRVTHRAGYVAK